MSPNRFLRRAAALCSASTALGGPAWAQPSSVQEAHANLGADLALWTVIPFVALLLAIAVLPLVAHHWWESNRNKALVAALFALPIAVYQLVAFGEAGQQELGHKLHEYVAFIVLLGSLYVISGGVYVRGSLAGTPLVNTGVLAFGAVIASVVGTTGASVLLIRPLLRANQSRERKAHIVVFFIFVVSNCGGLLTPLGDPPLYLGFLKGVPFEWTLRFWKEWLVVNAALLVIFNVWDQRVLALEEERRKGSQLEDVIRHEPLRVDGALNFLFLFGVVAVIYGSGSGLFHGGKPWPIGLQEALMVALALAAWFTTKRDNREKNRFTWTPIVEVAVLFAGIFVSMSPALLILNAWGQGQREVFGHAFGLHSPAQFFWATGVLSSFLDNAPTYLTFASTAAGLEHIPLDGPFLARLIEHGTTGPLLLEAISCGAVLMGANTYIGNGPNFMVKAIAEESGVKMPGFFGYMAYSSVVLLPLFGVLTWLFFA